MQRRSASKIIALCGKGGVGKTSISAMLVKILTEILQTKVLAIDADPAVGLATALGLEVVKSVDDIRNDLISRIKSKHMEDKPQMLARLDYEIFSALVERNNLAFLAIGRPEKEGCYCQVNHILKDIIASLANNFDYVVIDGEAGVEQVNRRVMESVTHLILISDASVKGLNVARIIDKVSQTAIQYEKSGLILNRIRKEDNMDILSAFPSLSYLGFVPESEAIRRCDMEGRSILNLSDNEVFEAVRNCISKLEILSNR